MKIFDTLDTHALHHAYVLEDSADAFTEAETFVRERLGAHDVHVRECDLFGIDESRDLARLAQMRSSGVQVFVYRIKRFTGEAQNALLKLFEEPPQQTHFFLCVNGVQGLLPTLRSRVWLLETDAPAEHASSLLELSLKERLSVIEGIAKEKDTAGAVALLDALEHALSAHVTREDVRSALAHITDVRAHIRDRGASIKILLESVAVTTPVIG